MIYCVCGFRIVMQCLFVLITAPCAVRFPTQCGRYFIATIEFASDSPDYTIQSKPMLIPGLPQNLKNHYKIETRFTCRLHPIKIMISIRKSCGGALAPNGVCAQGAQVARQPGAAVSLHFPH